MGKKKPRAPQRAQRPPARPSGEVEGLLLFMQQLLDEKRFTEALRAGQALVERDPLNPAVHAALGSVFVRMERPLEAMRQYELALRLGLEKDPDLLRSLVVVSTLARYPMHALEYARLGARLPGPAASRDFFANVVQSTEAYLAEQIGDRPLTAGVAERALLLTEQSARALQMDDAERARRRLEEAAEQAPAWPLVWNQQANLLFHLNDLQGARAACRQVLEHIDPQEPTALATLARIQATSGPLTEAEELVARLQALPATEPAVQVEVAKGLAILDRDREVYDRLQPALQPEDAQGSPLGRYLLSVAAANLGQREEARALWQELWRSGVAQVRPYLDIMARNEQPPTRNGRFAYFGATELVPAVILEELMTQVAADPHSPRLAEIAALFPRLADALCETFYSRLVDPRLCCDLLLRLPDPAIPDALRVYATSRASGDYDRVYAHLALRAAGFEEASAPASVWIAGRRRDLLLPRLRLVPPPPMSYDEEIRRLLTEGARAQEEDNAERAAEIYRRILEINPAVAEAEHNLGTALLLSGNFDEGEAHVRRSLELDPGYVLGRCNLASLELTRGNLAAAHELLDPLDAREGFTLEEVLAYLRTRSDLAHAEGDLARAEALLHALLAYDHENNLARERLATLTPPAVARTG